MHVVVDVDDWTQIIAVSRTAEKPLDEQAARAAIPMLFAKGIVLKNLLLTHGLLVAEEDQRADGSKGESRTVTKIAAVNAFFNNICYVCVSKVDKFPFPPCREPMCTCATFCRYGDCEHAEYVRMIDLRLRCATSSPESLPMQRKRGRKFALGFRSPQL